MYKNSKKVSSIIGMVSIILKNLISFLLTPLMIIVFGKGEFGVYKIVLSTISYLSLLDMGLNNGVVKYISNYKNTKDKETQNSFIGLIQVIYILISIGIFIISVIIFQYVPEFFKNSLTSVEIDLFLRMFILLVANTIILMVFNVYGGVIKAYENFLFLKIIQFISIVVRGGTICVLILNNSSIVFIALVDLVINVFIGLSKYLYVLEKIGLYPNVKKIRFKDSKGILTYSGFIFINMIAIQLFWASDSVILGVITNTTLVTVYSTGVMINSYFQSFAGVFTEFLMPSAVKLIQDKAGSERLVYESARIGRYILMILSLIVFVFIFIGDKFILLWLGEEFSIAYSIALLVIIPQLITYTQSFIANIMWVKEKHQFFSVIMLVVALFNCLVTVILVKKIGIIGAAIGTSFAYIIGFIIFASLYYQKVLKLNMILFYKILFNKILIAFIPITLLFYFVKILLPYNTWIVFLLQGIILTLIYSICMYLWGFNKGERKLVINYLKTLKKI